MTIQFGGLLRDWRKSRRMSQLDLALEAEVSARHLSFLETGRAAPSRAMVLHLSEFLQVPRAARNQLLKAAGYAEFYPDGSLNAADLAHIRQAIDWTLDRHDPFPAMAFDRHWRIVALNRAATWLLGAVDVQQGDSLLEALVHSEKLRSAVDNWDEAVRHLVARLRIESAGWGGDTVLDAAAEQLTQTIKPATPAPLSAVIPTRYRLGNTVLSLFSTIAQFGSAEDIMLTELRIELMFPSDPATRTILMAGPQVT
jgi:transcriptional regulator with XRE-family HTH domain